MKKYSILIVGLKCYSGHIREFVVNLKKNNSHVEISLITTNIRDEFREDISACVERIVMVNRYKGKVKILHFSTIMNRMFLYWSLIRLYFSGHFDIVDIHFPRGFVIHAMPILKRMAKTILITPWGSDVMRVDDEKNIKYLTQIYSLANYVTVGKDTQIGQCIISKFKVNPNKLIKLGWGGEFFDYIQEHSNDITTETAKARFGLNGRFVITCGYNTQREQRHEDIVNAIYKVKDQLPEELTLLFPFTYGKTPKSDKYTNAIIEKTKDLGLNVVVVDHHLDMMDLLKLRMATDIFVHIQTSDAGSRCVMEYVLCNKKVVHGAWIKYEYLEKYRPSCYFPVDGMECLGSVIVKACHTQVEDLSQDVKSVILDRGWGKKMIQWNSFFESLVS